MAAKSPSKCRVWGAGTTLPRERWHGVLGPCVFGVINACNVESMESASETLRRNPFGLLFKKPSSGEFFFFHRFVPHNAMSSLSLSVCEEKIYDIAFLYEETIFCVLLFVARGSLAFDLLAGRFHRFCFLVSVLFIV